MSKWASVVDAKTGKLVSVPKNVAAEIAEIEAQYHFGKITKEVCKKLIADLKKILPGKKEVAPKVEDKK